MKKLLLFSVAAMFATASFAKEKKYIAFGWEFRNITPAHILANADKFANLPIDGVGIILSANSPKYGKFSQISLTDDKPWVYEAFADQVPILREIVSKPGLKESFLAGYRAPIKRSAWTDDTAWAAIATNMAVVARIARESGIKGISIDHEDYRQQRQYYRHDTDPSYEETCKLARMRGRQVFEAVFREHPSAVLLSFWVLTEDRSYFATRDPAALMRQKQDLWPSFIAGIVDALPPTGRLVEGDEHGYRHEYFNRDFHAAAINAKLVGAQLLPEDVRRKYAACVEQGFGQHLDVYTHPYTPGKRATWSVGPLGGSRLEHFRRNLVDATDLAYEYVWLWGQSYAWIDWDDASRKNAAVKYETTWECMLPGLCEMLSAVKGGDDAELRRLEQLKAKGAVTNLIAKARVNRWKPEKDTRGRVLPHGKLQISDGIAECEGLRTGSFYCYLRNIVPGERYAFTIKKRGNTGYASITWGDDEGSCYRMPSPNLIFGKPDADGWCTGTAVLTVPESVNWLKLAFGAQWQKPGESVQFKDWAVFRLW